MRLGEIGKDLGPCVLRESLGMTLRALVLPELRACVNGQAKTPDVNGYLFTLAA